MKCPHCLESFHAHWCQAHLWWPHTNNWVQSSEFGGHLVVRVTQCPSCSKYVIDLQGVAGGNLNDVAKEVRVWPRGVARAPLSKEVPSVFSEDYLEACLVFEGSSKASAALSRRCLQHLLRQKGGATKRDLADQIDEVMPKLPSHLAEAIDGVRNIGNFAAHPIKSASSGEIVDVEPGEAEWLLDTLEGLFDFYFVQPALLAQKRAALDAKLKDTGKPAMK